jgi:hypothetical protein
MPTRQNFLRNTAGLGAADRLGIDAALDNGKSPHRRRGGVSPRNIKRVYSSTTGERPSELQEILTFRRNGDVSIALSLTPRLVTRLFGARSTVMVTSPSMPKAKDVL